MVLRPGATHHEPVSWEDARSHWRAVRGTRLARRGLLLTSKYNEAAFLYQLMVLRTNNLPTARTCARVQWYGPGPVIGIGKGTVTSKTSVADAIFVFGQNPGTTTLDVVRPPRSSAGRRADRQRTPCGNRDSSGSSIPRRSETCSAGWT